MVDLEVHLLTASKSFPWLYALPPHSGPLFATAESGEHAKPWRSADSKQGEFTAALGLESVFPKRGIWHTLCALLTDYNASIRKVEPNACGSAKSATEGNSCAQGEAGTSTIWTSLKLRQVPPFMFLQIILFVFCRNWRTEFLVWRTPSPKISIIFLFIRRTAQRPPEIYNRCVLQNLVEFWFSSKINQE